jgi:hypothetical protein
MNPIRLRRHNVTLLPESARVIIRPFIPADSHRITHIINRALALTEDVSTVIYYATYTAYNGRDILPQLIKTEDFLHFRILTLNGPSAKNKGMALFPHRIDGRYVMLSRQDNENIFIMFSDSPHDWSNPQVILRLPHRNRGRLARYYPWRWPDA